jgi:hypothetical protein
MQPLWGSGILLQGTPEGAMAAAQNMVCTGKVIGLNWAHLAIRPEEGARGAKKEEGARGANTRMRTNLHRFMLTLQLTY